MTEVIAFLEKEFAGARLDAWLQFVGTLVGVQIVAWLIKHLLERRHKGRITVLGDSAAARVIATILANTNWLMFLGLGVFVALNVTPGLPEHFVAKVHGIAILMLIIQVGIWGHNLIRMGVDQGMAKAAGGANTAASAAGIIRFFGMTALWAGIGILALQNLGIEVAPLIAGLGVGGIAVAFALQSILGDIFCSVAIVLDRPFVVGDFIIVGAEMGTVESIGIKTTRVRSLSGEQITFSNADLLGSRIRNYGRMQERRALFAFGILYQTPPDVVAEVPALVKKIITETKNTRFDRAHFKSFGASSLDFEVVYYVNKPDMALYLDAQQAINLGMMREFAARGIEFAYPTQTLFIEKLGDGPLPVAETAPKPA